MSYELRICDWSSGVCSSDLTLPSLTTSAKNSMSSFTSLPLLVLVNLSYGSDERTRHENGCTALLEIPAHRIRLFVQVELGFLDVLDVDLQEEFALALR